MKHHVFATLTVAFALSLSACVGTMQAKNENSQPKKSSSLRDTVVQLPVVKQRGMDAEQEKVFATCLEKLNKEQRAAHTASTENKPLYLAHAGTTREYMEIANSRRPYVMAKALLATVTFGAVNKMSEEADINENLAGFQEYMGMCMMNHQNQKMQQRYAKPR